MPNETPPIFVLGEPHLRGKSPPDIFDVPDMYPHLVLDKWEDAFCGKRVMVTGGTYGIGDAITTLFTLHGADVLVNFHNNEKRFYAQAQRLSESRMIHGGHIKLKADIADVEALDCAYTQTAGSPDDQGLDVLVLNAAGGAASHDPEESRRINYEAQQRVVAWARQRRLLRPGSIIVNMVSHVSHDFEKDIPITTNPLLQEWAVRYPQVAEFKNLNERALNRCIPEFESEGIRLAHVSAPIVPHTTPIDFLLTRDHAIYPNLVGEFGEASRLEVATTVLNVTADTTLPSGHVAFVRPEFVKKPYRL